MYPLEEVSTTLKENETYSKKEKIRKKIEIKT